MKSHGERAHSKFSASGAERWFNCPGSVELSEGLPDKSSVYAEEGTHAHEVLEAMMRKLLKLPSEPTLSIAAEKAPAEMRQYAKHAAEFIFSLHQRTPDSECLVENKVWLDFIHPDAFGTYDGAVIDLFGTLHVFDFKYGMGHAVSVYENLQMIFYGIGLAHKYHWNFKRVRLWIIQPRIKGYDGPTFWEVETHQLRSYVRLFELAVKRVLTDPVTYVEGSHCHWCKAKSICPLKQEARREKTRAVFGAV